MAIKRLEVYVDSYRNRPFIKDFDDKIELSVQDERVLEQWMTIHAGRRIAIDRNLRIEDVRHHFLDSAESVVHSTCIRVSLSD